MLGFFKIRLLFFVKPRLVLLNEEQVEVKIRLRRRTRNHLNSMYFGALAVGADVAAGIHAFYFCDKLGIQPHFAFKSMSAQFIKRVESHATFRCNSGLEIKDCVQQAYESKERQNLEVPIQVFNESDELVATFIMEMSIKLSR